MTHYTITRRVLAIACAALASRVVIAGEPLRQREIIPLGNVVGRIDHLAADPNGRRLFVAALGNNTVEVIDLVAGRVIKSVGGFHEPQGVAFINDKGLIAVAGGEDGTCRLIDTETFQQRGKFDFESDADNTRYDPAAKRLYVGFGNGAIGTIQVPERKRAADIKLQGHPESFQLEMKGSRIYVNVPTADQIAVIDRKQQKVIAIWQLDDARANFPMALDEPGHRLFVGCRTPAVVLVFDTETGKVINRFPTVGDTDDLFFDRQTHRLYVCGGEGYVCVYHRSEGDRYTQLAKVATAAGARTGLFVPELNRLFVAVPRHGTRSAEIRCYDSVR